MRPDDVLDRPASQPDAVIRYAEGPDGVIDVYLPLSLGRPERPAPVVLLVHGGFWRQAYDRVHLRPLAVALRAAGRVVALPEYRRVGGAGGWPRTGEDVESALAALPALVDAVAPGYADIGSPVTVAGHSAGGQLALWAGLRAGSERVGHVVALAPVADLTEAARQRLGDGAVQALLGGGPEDVPSAYADADPLRLLAAAVEDPDQTPRVTVIQGDADLQVPASANRRIADLATHSSASAAPDPRNCGKAHADTPVEPVPFPQFGVRVRYLELSGVDHFALIDPLSPAYDEAVLPAVTST